MASTCKYLCGVCRNPIRWNQAAILCEVCLYWQHIACIGMKKSEYSKLQYSEAGWCCDSCVRSAFPFKSCLSSIFSLSCLSVHSNNSTRSCSASASTGKSSMSIFYSNIRSLLPKLDEVHTVAGSVSPDIIAITESWLDPCITLNEVAISNYKLFRRDRNRHGGGVCLYIHESLRVTKHACHNSQEFVYTVINHLNLLILIGVYYRPPGKDSDLCDLDTTLGSLDLVQFSKVLITGDFNIDLNQMHSTQTHELLGLINSFGLHQLVINSLTRVTKSCSSTIDHLYTSDPSLVTAYKVLPPLSNSDHCSIVADLSLCKPASRPVRRKVWLYKRADFELINSSLETLLPDPETYSNMDVNCAWKLFKDTFLKVIHQNIPSKLVTSKRFLPWITKGVKKLMTLRDRANSLAKTSDTVCNWARFRRLCN